MDGGAVEAGRELVAKDAHRGVDVGLKGDQVGHGIDARHGLLERAMDVLVLRGENARNEFAARFEEEGMIEIGLEKELLILILL